MRSNCSPVYGWSIRNGYKQGKPSLNLHRLLGYRKEKDGRIEIDEEEAEVIRMIYRRYLAGYSTYRMALDFNEEQIMGTPWNDMRILKILRNERYMGDCLLQKSFVSDSGKQTNNEGQMTQYYIEDHHPAIISREDWEATQQRLDEHKKKRYPLSSMLHCAYCGATLIRSIADGRTISWRCATYIHHKKAACKGVKVPDRIVQAFHEKNPITEPMIVKETDHALRTQSRTLEHYDFSPLALQGKPGK